MLKTHTDATAKYTLRVDPRGFKMPYEIYGELDEWIKYNRYQHLTNRPRSPMLYHDQVLWEAKVK